MSKQVNRPYDMSVISQRPITSTTKPTVNQPVKGSKSFDQVLNAIQSKEIKFSKHAMDRMAERNIQFSSADMQKIESAVKKAESKGIKDALILMDNTVLVMSIKNRTVITASDEASLKDSVFTNIDGAVIL